jgi:hypothetical protein
VTGRFERDQPDVEPRVFRALESSLNMTRITSADEIAITFLMLVIAGLDPHVGAYSVVVPAKAGTHNHRGYDFVGWIPRVTNTFRLIADGAYGSRFREDDGGVCVGTLRKISDSNFKQPSTRVLAPPRELGF